MVAKPASPPDCVFAASAAIHGKLVGKILTSKAVEASDRAEG